MTIRLKRATFRLVPLEYILQFKPGSQATKTAVTSIFTFIFMPRHKMAAGHIEFTLSVGVPVFQIRVRPITALCMVGFTKHLEQLIIKTRRFVARKNKS